MTMPFDIEPFSGGRWPTEHSNGMASSLDGVFNCIHAPQCMQDFLVLEENLSWRSKTTQDKLARMSIHTKIEALRLAKGWSQTELAVQVSTLEGLAKPLSYSTVQQWEKNTAPKRTRLPFVAAALGTSVEDLLRDAPLRIEENIAGYEVNSAVLRLKHISAADLARLPAHALDQLERVIAAFIGSNVNIPYWRPIALSLAADLDRERGDDRLVTFVRAIDMEIERQSGRMKAARPAETQS